MKYILTPEFHRNVWLKFSPFRLIAAPVFIGICAAICLNIVPEKGVLFDRDYSNTLLMHGALWFYFLVVIIWGNYEAGTAMQEEIRGNTWDFQRMSSITALQLFAGKLFGSTSYVWYIGLLTLFPFYYGLSHFELTEGARLAFDGANRPVWEANNDIYVVFYLLLAGLIGHALAFLASFIDLTSFIAKTGKKRVPRGSGAFALGVVASWMVFALAQSVSPKLADYNSMFRDYQQTIWFGGTYDTTAFTTCAFVFFLAWFLVGSYRIARAELMHRTMPVAWMSFVGSLLFFAYGFTNPAGAYYFSNLLALFALSLFLCYAVMLFEASDGRKYARFYSYLQQGNFWRAFENMHKWAVTVPFVLVCYVATLHSVPETGKYITFSSMAAFMLAIMLFALRDGLVIHAAIRGKGGRNLGFKVMFYYLMVYVLLPFLHFAMMPKDLNPASLQRWIRVFVNDGSMSGEVPGVVKSLALYYPLPMPELAVSIGPALLEVLLAGSILVIGISNARLRRERDAGVIANPKG